METAAQSETFGQRCSEDLAAAEPQTALSLTLETEPTQSLPPLAPQDLPRSDEEPIDDVKEASAILFSMSRSGCRRRDPYSAEASRRQTGLESDQPTGECHGAAYPGACENNMNRVTSIQRREISPDRTISPEPSPSAEPSSDQCHQTSPSADSLEQDVNSASEESSEPPAESSRSGSKRSSRARKGAKTKRRTSKRLRYREWNEKMRKLAKAKRDRAKEKMEERLQLTYKDYMRKSNGNYERAYFIYMERERKKAQEPWAQLEEALKFIEDMRWLNKDRDKLKPVGDKDNVAGRARRPRAATTKSQANPEPTRTNKKRKNTSQPKQQLKQIARLNKELSTVQTLVDPEPKSQTGSSDGKSDSPAVSQNAVLPMTLTKNSETPSQLTTPDLPGGRAKPMCKNGPKELVSNLGPRWQIKPTENGRRATSNRKLTNKT
ncbi:hypothetical protein GGS21DRAFT_486880 [Xylaria nigripes]|nr:hypothetical protein GGS21DRAFT_486880 [Xylaria nigripes]